MEAELPGFVDDFAVERDFAEDDFAEDDFAAAFGVAAGLRAEADFADERAVVDFDEPLAFDFAAGFAFADAVFPAEALAFAGFAFADEDFPAEALAFAGFAFADEDFGAEALAFAGFAFADAVFPAEALAFAGFAFADEDFPAEALAFAGFAFAAAFAALDVPALALPDDARFADRDGRDEPAGSSPDADRERASSRALPSRLLERLTRRERGRLEKTSPLDSSAIG